MDNGGFFVADGPPEAPDHTRMVMLPRNSHKDQRISVSRPVRISSPSNSSW